MTEPKEVLQYQTAAGRVPFREWKESLADAKAQVKVDVRIGRLAMGHWGDFKHTGEGVFETRIHWGPGYRIYFGLDGVQLIILLSGGDKSRQAEDIIRAQNYWKDYHRRKP